MKGYIRIENNKILLENVKIGSYSIIHNLCIIGKECVIDVTEEKPYEDEDLNKKIIEYLDKKKVF